MSQLPKRLDRVRETSRIQHYALRTEQAYVNWSKRFIRFYNQLQAVLVLAHIARRLWDVIVFYPSFD